MAWDRKLPPKQAVTIVAAYETLRTVAYDDGSGYWTIGYGARRDPQGRPVTRTTPPISLSQAEAMLSRDLADAVASVRDGVPVELTDGQASALISLAFNLGMLASAAQSLCALLKSRDWLGAAKRLQVYRNSAGKPELGLRRRRWAEACIFLDLMLPLDAKARAEALIRTPDDWPDFPAAQPRRAESHG